MLFFQRIKYFKFFYLAYIACHTMNYRLRCDDNGYADGQTVEIDFDSISLGLIWKFVIIKLFCNPATWFISFLLELQYL